jgi:hypothetical protein
MQWRMETRPSITWIKKKYLVPAVYKKGTYRTRTGPRCCSDHCPSNRKKSKKAVVRTHA